MEYSYINRYLYKDKSQSLEVFDLLSWPVRGVCGGKTVDYLNGKHGNEWHIAIRVAAVGLAVLAAIYFPILTLSLLAISGVSLLLKKTLAEKNKETEKVEYYKQLRPKQKDTSNALDEFMKNYKTAIEEKNFLDAIETLLKNKGITARDDFTIPVLILEKIQNQKLINLGSEEIAYVLNVEIEQAIKNDTFYGIDGYRGKFLSLFKDKVEIFNNTLLNNALRFGVEDSWETKWKKYDIARNLGQKEIEQYKDTNVIIISDSQQKALMALDKLFAFVQFGNPKSPPKDPSVAYNSVLDEVSYWCQEESDQKLIKALRNFGWDPARKSSEYKKLLSDIEKVYIVSGNDLFTVGKATRWNEVYCEVIKLCLHHVKFHVNSEVKKNLSSMSAEALFHLISSDDSPLSNDSIMQITLDVLTNTINPTGKKDDEALRLYILAGDFWYQNHSTPPPTIHHVVTKDELVLLKKLRDVKNARKGEAHKQALRNLPDDLLTEFEKKVVHYHLNNGNRKEIKSQMSETMKELNGKPLALLRLRILNHHL